MTHSLSHRASSLFAALLLAVLVHTVTLSQTASSQPESEKLLNGLTIFFDRTPGDSNVLLKLRVRSGAAFDLADKGGTMALLGDLLFPDQSTRDYVSEQLGGKLQVETGYDDIEVTLSGKSSEFERLVDLLRGAVVASQLTAENFATARDARIKALSENQTSAARADSAIIKRLFGAFPYGHPVGGTIESLKKIERGDLLLAKERFLNADNASLVVIGGVEKARAMRTLRQLLGPWEKSTTSVPSTFRAPSQADTRIEIVDHPDDSNAELRVAVRGLARADQDADAAALLSRIVGERLKAASPDFSSVFARNEAHLLPGMFVLGLRTTTMSLPRALGASDQILQTLAQIGPSPTELDQARRSLIADLEQQNTNPDGLAESWLDINDYQLPAVNQRLNSINKLTVEDLKRLAARLFKNQSSAKVVVGSSKQLILSFQRSSDLSRDKNETTAEPAVPKKP